MNMKMSDPAHVLTFLVVIWKISMLKGRLFLLERINNK